jgi:hypothetical protein
MRSLKLLLALFSIAYAQFVSKAFWEQVERQAKSRKEPFTMTMMLSEAISEVEKTVTIGHMVDLREAGGRIQAGFRTVHICNVNDRKRELYGIGSFVIDQNTDGGFEPLSAAFETIGETPTKKLTWVWRQGKFHLFEEDGRRVEPQPPESSSP